MRQPAQFPTTAAINIRPRARGACLLALVSTAGTALRDQLGVNALEAEPQDGAKRRLLRGTVEKDERLRSSSRSDAEPGLLQASVLQGNLRSDGVTTATAGTGAAAPAAAAAPTAAATAAPAPARAETGPANAEGEKALSKDKEKDKESEKNDAVKKDGEEKSKKEDKKDEGFAQAIATKVLDVVKGVVDPMGLYYDKVVQAVKSVLPEGLGGSSEERRRQIAEAAARKEKAESAERAAARNEASSAGLTGLLSSTRIVQANDPPNFFPVEVLNLPAMQLEKLKKAFSNTLCPVAIRSAAGSSFFEKIGEVLAVGEAKLAAEEGADPKEATPTAEAAAATKPESQDEIQPAAAVPASAALEAAATGVANGVSPGAPTLQKCDAVVVASSSESETKSATGMRSVRLRLQPPALNRMWAAEELKQLGSLIASFSPESVTAEGDWHESAGDGKGLFPVPDFRRLKPGDCVATRANHIYFVLAQPAVGQLLPVRCVSVDVTTANGNGFCADPLPNEERFNALRDVSVKFPLHSRWKQLERRETDAEGVAKGSAPSQAAVAMWNVFRPIRLRREMIARRAKCEEERSFLVGVQQVELVGPRSGAALGGAGAAGGGAQGQGAEVAGKSSTAELYWEQTEPGGILWEWPGVAYRFARKQLQNLQDEFGAGAVDGGERGQGGEAAGKSSTGGSLLEQAEPGGILWEWPGVAYRFARKKLQHLQDEFGAGAADGEEEGQGGEAPAGKSSAEVSFLEQAEPGGIFWEWPGVAYRFARKKLQNLRDEFGAGAADGEEEGQGGEAPSEKSPTGESFLEQAEPGGILWEWPGVAYRFARKQLQNLQDEFGAGAANGGEEGQRSEAAGKSSTGESFLEQMQSGGVLGEWPGVAYRFARKQLQNLQTEFGAGAADGGEEGHRSEAAGKSSTGESFLEQMQSGGILGEWPDVAYRFARKQLQNLQDKFGAGAADGGEEGHRSEAAGKSSTGESFLEQMQSGGILREWPDVAYRFARKQLQNLQDKFGAGAADGGEEGQRSEAAEKSATGESFLEQMQSGGILWEWPGVAYRFARKQLQNLQDEFV